MSTDVEAPRADDEPRVYYLRRRDGSIKIGTTRRPHERYREVARDQGPVRVLATHVGDVDAEHRMHARFADHRLDGEWFAPHPELLAWIDEINDAQRLALFEVAS